MKYKKIANCLMGIYLAFLSLFAFDTSGLGLLIHLIPSFILLALILFANKKSKLGGWLILGLAVVFFFFFKFYRDLISFLTLNLPLVVAGLLYLRSTKKPA